MTCHMYATYFCWGEFLKIFLILPGPFSTGGLGRGLDSSSLCRSDCSLKLCVVLSSLGARLSVRSMLFSNFCWMLWMKLMLLPWFVVRNLFSLDL